MDKNELQLLQNKYSPSSNSKKIKEEKELFFRKLNNNLDKRLFAIFYNSKLENFEILNNKYEIIDDFIHKELEFVVKELAQECKFTYFGIEFDKIKEYSYQYLDLVFNECFKNFKKENETLKKEETEQIEAYLKDYMIKCFLNNKKYGYGCYIQLKNFDFVEKVYENMEVEYLSLIEFQKIYNKCLNEVKSNFNTEKPKTYLKREGLGWALTLGYAKFVKNMKRPRK